MTGAAQRIAAEVARPGSLRWFRAPGRVNLIGDHTDYNDGFVLPMAIDRDCVVAVRPAATVRVRSLDVGGTVEIAADGGAGVERVDTSWGRLVAGLLHELDRLGRPAVGMDAVVSSDVPLGSGLSSSASFEVALAVALAAAADWSPDRLDLAQACRAAEELALGVPCGIMDQLSSVAGRDGHALLVDCRSLEVTPVRLPDGIAVLVVHSGQARALAGSEYAERRAACHALARRLGVDALRDATPADVADDPLGRHVVGENQRVLDAARALADGDLGRLAALLTESHASLRDDFAVSTPQLDALVDELNRAGAIGARLTGAGFGGSVVALCDLEAAEAVAGAASAAYRRRTGLEPRAFRCRAVDGAGPLEAP